MNRPCCIRSFLATSLVILLGLQAGPGRWYHMALHHHPAVAKSHPATRQPAFVAVCDCLDFLSVPFTPAEAVTILLPIRVFLTGYVQLPVNRFAGASYVFRPLRAPPVSRLQAVWG